MTNRQLALTLAVVVSLFQAWRGYPVDPTGLALLFERYLGFKTSELGQL